MAEVQHKGKEEHSLCPFYYPKLSTVLLLPVVYGSDIIKTNNSKVVKFRLFKIMDTFQTSSQTSPVDKFKLGKKWFWIGIVVSTLNIVAGLVYGITLLIEKDHRKEGLVVMAWAIIWALIGFFVIGPYLIKSGLLPKFQMIKSIPYQEAQLPQQL